MNKKQILETICATMRICENFPCGGIGARGPTQLDLDGAIAAGGVCGGDDSFHRGQQIWLNLNHVAEQLVDS